MSGEPNAMSRLRHAELRRFSNVVWELGSAVSADNLSDHLLRGIARLIDVDRVSYNEVDRQTGKLVRAHSLGDPPSPELVASLNAHIHQHPGFSRPDSDADLPVPTKLSDSLSQRQFRQLGLYHEHFRLYGIHYQLGASFALNRERKISFGLNRQTRDFSESHRLMIGLLCPHLRRVCQQTNAAAEVRAAVTRREHTLQNMLGAVVLLDAAGQVEFATASALQLLEAYSQKEGDFAAGVRSPLPPPVARWLRQQAGGGGAPATRRPQGDVVSSSWTVRQGDGELRLQVVEEISLDADTWQTKRRWLLKLREHSAALSAAPLRDLGLSVRESEVLFWLAQGKRNAEIATICRLRTTTVSTHVRNIFPKLGVETRTAAAATAWRKLASGGWQSQALPPGEKRLQG